MRHTEADRLKQAAQHDRSARMLCGWQRLVVACAALSLLFPALGAAQSSPALETADMRSRAGLPPPQVVSLLEAPPPPAVAADPIGRHVLLVHQRELVPLEVLAAPTLSIGGLRINPKIHGQHAPLDYYGLTVVDIDSGARKPLALPPDVRVGYPRWSPDGARFAFTVTSAAGIALWVGDPVHGTARQLVEPVLNGTLGVPCAWMPDGHQVVCRLVPRSRRTTRFEAAPAQAIPVLTQLSGFPASTAEAADAQLVKSLLEAQLVLIDVDSGQRRPIGQLAAFESVEPAPSGAFLLVSRWLPPYTEASTLGRPYRVTEVWDKAGRIVQTVTVDSPSERREARRAVQWHASQPATLVWVEAADNGGDRVVAQAPPFTAPAVSIFEAQHRFAGMTWLEDSPAALISEYDAEQRLTHVWLVDSSAPGESQARRLGGRNVDYAVHTFGRPLSRENVWGKRVIAVHEGDVFVRGEEATESGTRSYLDRVSLASGDARRVWTSSTEMHETVVDLLTADGRLLLTQRESAQQPPNYVVNDLSLGSERQVTDYRHPAPQLAQAKRIPLRYQRADGQALSAMLYIPVDHDGSEALPLIVWAYPRQYGNAAPALTLPRAERFPDFKQAFKLFFLLRGFAVLDSVAMPVIGNPRDANDTFIDQIVANAQAAIDAAAATGLADPKRVGVAGHSYGAFMVANLLAHSRLFRAGIAMSGAYNRTLTPFGFQTERRTLWQARETYLELSPILYSDLVEAPLLLVHGLLDENAGTQPIQSTYFYEAIRRNGGEAELLLLPLEGHSYRGRESVLQTAAAMLGWFEKYLKPSTDPELPHRTVASTVERP